MFHPRWRYSFLLIFTMCVYIKAVTVNPLCPTNKIAPHKRYAEWDHQRGRTFGLFYHLLAPNHNNYQNDPQDDLQEQPQNDDPDDCGEIDDYDENDLSSVTYPQSQRRKEYGNNEYYGNGYGNVYNGGINRPYPQTTQRPSRPHYNPTRPPYSSGGYFENNNYRPSYQRPSDRLKPVNENQPEFQSSYDPQVVGGPLGHVVGFSPVRPTRYPRQDTGTKSPNRHVRFPPSDSPTRYSNNRPSPRRFDENTVVGSFISLFLK